MSLAAKTLAGSRLSPQQQWLWHRQQATGTVAVTSCAVEIAEGADAGVLLGALALAVARHEILRTTFDLLQGMPEPLQVITEAPPAWHVVELTGLPAPAREATGERLLDQLAGVPHDLARGPVLRATVLGLGPGRSLLHVSLPGLCADRLGLAPLVRELGRSIVPREAGPVLQYADLAEWQNRLVEVEASEAERRFWQEQDVPSEALPLPGEIPPPAVLATDSVVAIRTRVPRSLLAAVEAAAGVEASLSEVFLSAWLVLLWRLSGGSPVVEVAFAGRRYDELQRLPGRFVRFLPVRVPLDALLPIGEVVRRLGGVLEELALFQESWDPRASVAGTQRIGFEWHEEENEITVGDLVCRYRGAWSRGEPWRVKLDCVRRGREVEIELQAGEGCLPGIAAHRLLDHYFALLASAVEERENAIGTLSFLTAAEREQLRCLNDTERRFAGPHCLHDLVAAAVGRTPDKIVLLAERDSVTFGELARRARLVAGHLRAAGVGPEARVAVHLERSVDLVVALLGVLMAGGAYVPLETAYPVERLRFMLSDARPRVLLTHRGLAAALADPAVPTLTVEAALGEPPASLPSGSAGAAGPHNLAYLIYTSGSSGRPKGVMIPHHAIVNRLLWMQDAFPLAPWDRVVQKTPVSFDASVWEIFSPLSAGAELILAPPAASQDMELLAEFVAVSEVTVLQLVPSLLRVVLATERLAGASSLRRIFCGGETLPAALAARSARELGVELHNLYGPTECAIDVTSWTPGGEDERSGAAVPIGRPIANLKAFLLDADMGMEVAPGTVGELWVAGAGLGRGYFGRPDLTADRFRPDPFAADPGGRLYRTGDLAVHRVDGGLVFAGRIDQQVKIRGVRIEPEEIEAVLLRHPGVREAMVQVRGTAGVEEPSLCACVVPVSWPAPEAAELRALLARSLPAAMLPGEIVACAALPRTPSGKLRRDALPAAPRQPVAPALPPEMSGVTSRLLADLWQELLGLPEVALDDDFFAVGGHSLLATQLFSRLRRDLGVELPLRSLFDAPRLRAFTATVEAARRAAGKSAAHPAPAIGRGERPDSGAELSFAQQRLWFLDQLDPGSIAYNLPLAVRLDGPLDVALLARAATSVIARHEVLRTTFPSHDGLPVQRIAAAAPVVVPLVDLRALPAAGRQSEALLQGSLMASAPFDLAAGPLVRWVVIRLEVAAHVALTVLHHIVSDAWSTVLLWRDLAESYRSGGAALPDLAVQYADFAQWQRLWLAGEPLAALLAYWQRQLTGVPALDLPADRPRPLVPSGRGSRLPVRFERELVERLAEVARRHGATLFMLLVASWDVLLLRYTGQTDLAIGTPVAGRNRLEIEELIGFFVNTLVLRTDVAGNPSFAELLARVRGVALDAAAHQDLPFEKLVEALQPQRDAGRPLLFSTFLALQPAAAGVPVHLGGTTATALRLLPSGAKFDLTLDLAAVAGCLEGSIEYSTDLFDGVTLARLGNHFGALLRALAATPQERLAELPLLGAAERFQLTTEWALPVGAIAPEMALGELFARRASAHGDAVAVVHKGEWLTYSELSRRGAGLARRLRRLGVGVETRVGLLVERSLDLLTGMVGILAAGGAYLPLDPGYPAEHLAFLLADAGATALVTVERLLPAWLPARVRPLCLDGGAAAPQASGPAVGPSGGLPDAAAYVIYTSGSTGRPKGVAVASTQVTRLFAATAPWLSFGQQDVWTLFHSVAFDFSVWEIWGALLHGGRLVVVPYAVSRSADAFLELLDRERVTMLSQTPGAFRELAQAEEEAPCDLALRWVVFGGEALAVRSLRPWIERHGWTRPRLANMYGITETTVHVTFCELGARDLAPAAGSAIGAPLLDVTAQVLDAVGGPSPLGVPGELYVGGGGVARGYLDRPELTAERFVPDPWGGSPGGRLYRSGDRVRRRPDGGLEYLGRLDQQVKVRGFRIELGEVEAVLALHPAVGEAVVMVRSEREWQDRLVAYLVARDAASAVPELRSFLAARLPLHMVPAAFVILAALPLTANGKLDRGRLPAPDGSRPESGRPYVEPLGTVEQVVAGVWKQVLGVDRVGAEDDFFVLGGHSLLATQVVSRLRRTFHCEVSLRGFFAGATVAEVSRWLVAHEAMPGQVERIALLVKRVESMSVEELQGAIAERSAPRDEMTGGDR